MKAIVVYKSSTGFTKKYADWIAQALGCEAVALQDAKRIDYSAYDALIFG